MDGTEAEGYREFAASFFRGSEREDGVRLLQTAETGGCDRCQKAKLQSQECLRCLGPSLRKRMPGMRDQPSARWRRSPGRIRDAVAHRHRFVCVTAFAAACWKGNAIEYPEKMWPFAGGSVVGGNLYDPVCTGDEMLQYYVSENTGSSRWTC